MELNTTYGHGDTHEVVFTNSRGGGFTFFIGFREECEAYINDNPGLPDGTEIFSR